VVPVRFKLGGNPGPDVVAPGSPVVERARCDTWAPIGEAEPAVGLGPRLLYSPATGLYTSLWKTDSRFAGSCRLFVLELDDGTIHRARFRFLARHGGLGPIH
jgi:hypothetical protein